MTAVPNLTFTPTGFQAPPESAVLNGVQADQNAAFRGNLNPALNTPQGQIASSTTAIIGQSDTDFITLSQLMDPAFSFGRFQDAIGRIVPGNGFARNPPQPTVVQGICNGAQGVNIPIGQTVAGADGNLYVCVEAGTIPVSGSIALTFQCTVTGPIACPEGNLGPQPYQALPGLDTITNTSPGVVGNVVESRADFEFRRQGSVAANAVAVLPAVRGAVFEVPNVIDCYTAENDNSSALVVGPSAAVTGSITTTNLTVSAVASGVVVVGNLVSGTGVTAGTTIVSQTSGATGGIGVYVVSASQTVGSEALTIGGVSLIAKSMYVSVTGGASAAVAQAIWSKKPPGCAYNGNTSVTVYDTSPPYVSPYPSYTVSYETPAPLPFVFSVVISNSAGVPSSALALIQTAILAAFAGSDGGARARTGSSTYASRYYANVAVLGSWASIIDVQIGSPNTPAASFTGSVSGATLTVASVQQGAVAIGQAVFGPGVATGTYITGGSGTSWTVNISQTVGANTAMTGVTANQNIVTAQINQAPTLDASNIALVLV
jgi:hypothetical protein